MVRGRIRHEEQHRAGERSDADGRPEGGVPVVPGPRAQLLPAARGPATCRVAGGAGERAHASPEAIKAGGVTVATPQPVQTAKAE
jgi:hypothetical protein